MTMQPLTRIILTGFSGSGKSTVAALLAARLGWESVDTDNLIVERAGRSITQIFAEDGEARFRELETEALREACSREWVVIACGGGAILSATNRKLLADGGFIVCLEARPETLLARLQREDAGELRQRPLLDTEDALGRIRDLKARRQPYYALADYTIHTDSLTPEEVAAEVERAFALLRARPSADRLSGLSRDEVSPVPVPAVNFPGSTCVVTTPNEHYPVYVGWGTLTELGRHLHEVGLRGRVWLITDENVRRLYGEAALAALRAAGFEAEAFALTPGEPSKSLDTAALVYDWLIAQRAERRDVIVALGGGVVGDLAGYVAATFLRGLAFVQVPTSLLAMVDAAIGGKVAVNHREGKNLIGAFYQPRLVLVDVALLSTLPQRELREGWSEAIKHALILDLDLLERLEGEADRVLRLDPEVVTPIVGRSIALKAMVVSQDPREETGRRTILNYGHTIGHALEAATAYGQLLHGEAVAIGMMGAAEISRRMGLLASAVVERQRAILRRFGLPLRSPPGVDPDRVLAALALDKKVSGKAVRWVLLEDVGRTVLRDDVPPEMVRDVVKGLIELKPSDG